MSATSAVPNRAASGVVNAFDALLFVYAAMTTSVQAAGETSPSGAGNMPFAHRQVSWLTGRKDEAAFPVSQWLLII
jgi:hypothetical protein